MKTKKKEEERFGWFVGGWALFKFNYSQYFPNPIYTFLNRQITHSESNGLLDLALLPSPYTFYLTRHPSIGVIFYGMLNKLGRLKILYFIDLHEHYSVFIYLLENKA
ncbi:hypothetical protein RND81_12G124200 [Saponaria officinalis]|uniref:Uncharacterized protein n=1 Tax=Saponaria officinalis TaxID=3572 RepID=A0AAW1H9Q6_SAPOF